MHVADINESDRRTLTIAKRLSMLSFSKRRPAKAAGATRTACPVVGDSAFKRRGCWRAASGRVAEAACGFARIRANSSFLVGENESGTRRTLTRTAGTLSGSSRPARCRGFRRLIGRAALADLSVGGRSELRRAGRTPSRQKMTRRERLSEKRLDANRPRGQSTGNDRHSGRLPWPRRTLSS